MANPPLSRWRIKGMSLAAWQHPKGYVTYSYEKSYYDKANSEWKQSKILFREDLLALAEMAQEASNWELKGATPEGFRVKPSEQDDFLNPLPPIKVNENTKPSTITDDDDIPF